jgi:hypothetical protein
VLQAARPQDDRETAETKTLEASPEPTAQAEELTETLGAAIDAWLQVSIPDSALERRSYLLSILRQTQAERLSFTRLWPPDNAGSKAFLASASQRAFSLLERPWLQTPYLVALYLEDLLAGALGRQAGRCTNAAFNELSRVWNEINSHHFDAEDCRRRLLSLDAQGLGVHSLVYPLLDLSQTLRQLETTAGDSPETTPETFPSAPWDLSRQPS